MLVVKANTACEQKPPNLTVMLFLRYLCSHYTGGGKYHKET